MEKTHKFTCIRFGLLAVITVLHKQMMVMWFLKKGQNKASCELRGCSEVLSRAKEIVSFTIQSERIYKYV